MARILLEVMSDPRLKGVAVTRATVSDDIQHARIFVRVIGTPANARTAMRALASATGRIQSELASRMETRYTPRLSFAIDEDVEKARRMDELFQKVEAERPKEPPKEAPPS